MLNTTKIINEYLSEEDWRVKENSNMCYSLSGLNNHIVSHATSYYWLNHVYPKDIADCHLNGDLHLHDLQMLSSYCFGMDLKQLLQDGFGGVSGKVQSNPPKHLRTALGQMVNFMFSIANEVAGAVAFSNFDTLLAPYIRKDNLSQKEVKQAIQEFIFNMNVATRTGGQQPFSNITLDIKPAGKLAKESAFCAGEILNKKYEDFQPEIDMINIAFTEVMCEGDSKGRVFSFPIPTYNLTKGFDWDSPVADKIFEMTAKYGIPYFANYINSDMTPDQILSMCCRLSIRLDELEHKGGGLFGSGAKTGSVGVVTINLPRLGYVAETEDELFDRLKELMVLAKDSLEIKRIKIEDYTEKGLYPYTKIHLQSTKDRFDKYWQNHFSTIGIVGMNELLLNFNNDDITTKTGQELAKKILKFMRNILIDFQKETGNHYNLEATPAEGTTRRLATMDRKLYPDIISANLAEGTTPYYTNSTNLPVGYTDDVFEMLDLQDELQCLYSGGTVSHCFLGEEMPSPMAIKSLVKKIATNYKLPYFSISPTFSICPKHGYLFGEHKYCPVCDEEIGYKENDN